MSVKGRREAKGITGESLAHKAGITGALISQIEHRKLRLTYRVAERIAPILGVSPLVLIAEQCDEIPDPNERAATFLTGLAEAIPDLPNALLTMVQKMKETTVKTASGEDFEFVPAPPPVLETELDRQIRNARERRQAEESAGLKTQEEQLEFIPAPPVLLAPEKK